MIVLKEYPAIGIDDIIFLIVIGIVTLAFLIMGIIALKKNRKIGIEMFPAVIAITLVFLALTTATGIRASHKRYDLFVSDDSIPFDVFCSKWRIIKIEGDTITAERKEPFLHCFECDTDILNDWSIYCPDCGRRIER